MKLNENQYKKANVFPFYSDWFLCKIEDMIIFNTFKQIIEEINSNIKKQSH